MAASPDVEAEAPNTHKHLTDEKSRVSLLGRPEHVVEDEEEQSIAHHIPTLDEHEIQVDDRNDIRVEDNEIRADDEIEEDRIPDDG